MIKPNVCVLKTDGTNCDEETSYAFSKAGGECRIVHLNQLRSGNDRLSNYQILAIPGGFSYGDDIVSGKVLAIELISFFKDQLQEFVAAGKLIIGICNGFQILARSGLLPFRDIGNMQVTLAHNSSGHFECRWVELWVRDNPCVFTKGIGYAVMQIAHGEGRFYAEKDVLAQIECQNLVAMRYSEHNPNGSLHDIAGICDPTGRIFGLMPHPERIVELTQYPNWREIRDIIEPNEFKIFKNAIGFFK